MKKIIATLPVILGFAAVASAQTSVVLDGTSGSNVLTNNYSTSGGLVLGQGFFADYLVIGGGGGGGGSGDDGTAFGGGGGGAGGMVFGGTQLSTQNYAVTVGAGGAGGAMTIGGSVQASQQGSNGGNSAFGSISALGGGGGGRWQVVGNAGGSGGGGGGRGTGNNLRTAGGAGTAGQGFAGGASRDDNSSGRSAGGGGGGAGGLGGTGGTDFTIPGNGGAGLANSITGSSVIYAGGGGGGAQDTFAAGAEVGGTGGSGGGGAGSNVGNAGAGQNGRGSGGGGAGTQGAGGKGGSGVVIVRYQGSSLGNIGGAVSVGSGSAAGYTLHTFTNTGSANFNLSGVNMANRLGSVLNGTISGDGSLTYQGPGSLTLAAANTYTGDTRVTAGTLKIANVNALQNSTLDTSEAGTVNFVGSGSTYNLGGLIGNGNLSMGGNSLAVGANNAEFQIYTGGLSGNGGLTKVGSGNFILGGANSYLGDTVVSSGKLTLSSSNALSVGAVLKVDAGATLQVNQRTVVGFLENNGTVTGSGSVVSAMNLVNGGNVSATIADGSDYRAGIIKRTGATAVIDGNHTFTGTVKVEAGTLELASNGSLNGNASLSMSGGGTMALNRSQAFSQVNGTGGTVEVVGTANQITVSGSENSSFGGSITGTGGLVKSGAGLMQLNGSSSYTGTTQVQGGALAVNGDNSAATGDVTVTAGGTLKGSGTVGGQITVSSGGHLAPGNSPGLLTAANGVALATGSVFEWELTDNTLLGRGTSFDGVDITGGNLSIGMGVTSSLVFDFVGSTVNWADEFWDVNQTWLVFDSDNAPTLASGSVFDTVNVSADSMGALLSASRTGSYFSWYQTGNDVVLAYNVPEPSSGALLVLGLGGLLALRRSRRA